MVRGSAHIWGRSRTNAVQRGQFIWFKEGGRKYVARITLARDASERRIAQAYKILDRLKLTT